MKKLVKLCLTNLKKGKGKAIVVGILIVGALIWYLMSGGSSSSASQHQDQFNPYISAYTSGAVSSNAGFRIQLAEASVDSSAVGQDVSTDVFHIKPSIPGKAYWLDARTIEFTPEKRLAPGTEYQIIFYLDKLLPKVAEEYAAFPFSIRTMQQSYTLDVEGLSTYESRDLKRQKLEGVFQTADFAEGSVVEKAFTAYQQGNTLKVSWQHDPEGKLHRFTVENIQRGEKESKVKITSTGEPLHIDKKSDFEVEVPALGDFKLTDAEIVQNPEQYVLLKFSDPLQEKQDLKWTGDDRRAKRPYEIHGERKQYQSISTLPSDWCEDDHDCQGSEEYFGLSTEKQCQYRPDF